MCSSWWDTIMWTKIHIRSQKLYNKHKLEIHKISTQSEIMTYCWDMHTFSSYMYLKRIYTVTRYGTYKQRSDMQLINIPLAVANEQRLLPILCLWFRGIHLYMRYFAAMRPINNYELLSWYRSLINIFIGALWIFLVSVPPSPPSNPICWHLSIGHKSRRLEKKLCKPGIHFMNLFRGWRKVLQNIFTR